MTHFTISYLLHRFLYRIGEFLLHWYVKSFKKYSDAVLEFLRRIDYHLAWKITFQHLFEPLYKDHSVVGYVLGFVFRSGRLFVASCIYGFVFITTLAIYIFWLCIPPLLVYLMFK